MQFHLVLKSILKYKSGKKLLLINPKTSVGVKKKRT